MDIPWVRGALWERILRATKHAMERGTLKNIMTEKSIFVSDGVPFTLRLMGQVGERRFDAARAKPKDERFNPFLPYEKDMYVCDVGPHHVCLLNKFNVMDNHALLVTKKYEEQVCYTPLGSLLVEFS